MKKPIHQSGHAVAVLVSTMPQWIIDLKNRNHGYRYSREGMTDMIISAPSIRLDQKLHDEAEQLLKELEVLMETPVTIEHIQELFSIVNSLVANPLGKSEFGFKINAIYSVFSTYPACIFNSEVARKLATVNIFFPSANEIQKILKEAKEGLSAQINFLKLMTRQSFSTSKAEVLKEAERRKKIDQQQQKKIFEEREYQHRVLKLKNRFKFIDDLTIDIEKAVASYIPDNHFNMHFDRLVKVFSDKMNATDDLMIKEIFSDKIQNLWSAQHQCEQLERLNILPKKMDE